MIRITCRLQGDTKYVVSNLSFFLVSLLTIPILSACVGRDVVTPYVPPTIAPASPRTVSAKQPQAGQATEAVAIQEPEAAPTPDCVPNLTFLEDLTVPDGTLVNPGTVLDKRWQVENSGNCNWDRDYRLKLISGPEMGANPVQALYPARTGTQVVIRMKLTAPAEPGAYRSEWQASDPQGEPFGDPLFIQIIIQE